MKKNKKFGFVVLFLSLFFSPNIILRVEFQINLLHQFVSNFSLKISITFNLI